MWSESKIVAFQSEEASYHYENFAPNEPNDSSRGEDCVVKRMDRQGEWMDIPCNTYNRWTLCEAAGILFYDESVREAVKKKKILRRRHWSIQGEGGKKIYSF